MIVLELTSDYLPNPLWGMGWHVNFLTGSLRNLGVKVYIGTASKSKNSDKDIFTTSHYVDNKYLSKKPYEIFDNFIKFSTWQKLLGREIIKNKITIDIIHCHNWMSWLSALEIKKKNPNIKIVSTFHLLQKQYDLMEENPVQDCHEEIIKIENQMLQCSDQIILQSDSQFNIVKAEYSKIKDYSKLNIIYSGIRLNTQTYKKIKDKKDKNPFIDIVFVGRVEKDKGIEQTIQAFTIISEKYNNVRLHILGKGSKLAELSQKYISDKIIFHGFVGKEFLEEILGKSAIFCLPSSSESFGNTVVEAMSFGVVPIFPKGKTVPILFEEKVHGLNISLKLRWGKYVANPKEIAQKIDFLIRNPKLLNKLSRKTYKYARANYSVKKMAKETLNVYHKSLYGN